MTATKPNKKQDHLRFILWAAEINQPDKAASVALVGPEHKSAIAAAAEELIRLGRVEQRYKALLKKAREK